MGHESLDLFKTQSRWTDEQEAVCEAIAYGEGNLLVRARAGSGKTSVIIEGLSRMRGRHGILLCAFNKVIAHELRRRAPPSVEVKTLDALGFRAMQSELGPRRFDPLHDVLLMERAYLEVTEPFPKKLALGRSFLRMLTNVGSLFKSRMSQDREWITSTVRSRIRNSIPSKDRWQEEKFNDSISLFVDAILLSLDLAVSEIHETTSFSDMVYVPASVGISAGSYRVVIVDETQDMSRAQLIVARSALAPRGRMIVVGDERQCLYSWRGAAEDGMDRMKEEMSAQELPISISQRCPRLVVSLCREWVPDFRAKEGATDGIVRAESIHDAEWRIGDMVISRTNHELVILALDTIRRGTPAKIQGRDIGRALKADLRASQAEDIATLCSWIVERLKLLGAAQESDRGGDIEEEIDMARTLGTLCSDVRSIKELEDRLEKLFDDADSMTVVTFSSVHRAKGLERDRIWVIAETFFPERDEESANIWYVALSRSKRELVLVYGVRDKGYASRYVAGLVQGLVEQQQQSGA